MNKESLDTEIDMIVKNIDTTLNYCFYSQQILKDEVNRCSEAKSELEKSILKKRRSSKKGKKS